MSAVDIEGLHKTYYEDSWNFWREGDNTVALNGVSFSVEEGEIFGIVGPNGAGKTTLINILSGLIYKDKGEVQVFDKDVERNREELSERMNVATAYSSLTGPLTVHENLKVFGTLYNAYSEEKVDELLELFEIPELKDKRVWSLSAGQKTRANLCKAFINEPDLLLLDEVTAGLDPHISQVTRDAIKDMREEKGTTIIVTSHDMEDIDQLSDRMMFLHEGEVLRTDTPDQIKEDLHVKVLDIAVDEVTSELKSVVNEFNGDLKKNGASFEIREEKQIIEILDRVSDLEVTVTDINASSPDLDELFQKVARGEL
ncbi:MAG: ABC transporter ATP-binding protein [Candidatus Nanohaloarchaea archaeon]